MFSGSSTGMTRVKYPIEYELWHSWKRYTMDHTAA